MKMGCGDLVNSQDKGKEKPKNTTLFHFGVRHEEIPLEEVGD